jgi:hypothetical protein
VHEVDIDKAHRETARWRILVTLNYGRPLRTNETIILRVLQDESMPITPHGLRNELGYLEARNLIKVHGKDSPIWSAELTRYGIDLVDYSIDCEPGIARPQKWY